VNIAINDASPAQYLARIHQQIETKILDLGEIKDRADLLQNFQENALPEGLEQVDATNYFEFLAKRRVLMAAAIKDYYEAL
ncbi:hypothetical protein BZG17_29300, partial [Escherichia coli]|nr:hypothetical protein [Escherichia coli]